MNNCTIFNIWSVGTESENTVNVRPRVLEVLLWAIGNYWNAASISRLEFSFKKIIKWEDGKWIRGKNEGR
jgi:hypothetical protein